MNDEAALSADRAGCRDLLATVAFILALALVPATGTTIDLPPAPRSPVRAASAPSSGFYLSALNLAGFEPAASPVPELIRRHLRFRADFDRTALPPAVARKSRPK